MAEMEGEAQNLDHESLIQSPLKRKCDLIPDEEGEDERAMKLKKPDAPLEELREVSSDDNKEGANQNGNVSKEKGKSILSAADKGKGKMVVDVEEGGDEKRGRELGVSSDDEDGSSEVHGDDDDTDFDDDPLAELDLDNILPVRTRQRSALEPGAYLVEGGDDDDDDDDDHVEEEEEEDEEDEEVDEGEEVEDEDKQEETK